eukprot:4106583-Pyramimonas_sp.AAC.1
MFFPGVFGRYSAVLSPPCGEALAAFPSYNEEEVIYISHESWVPIRFHVPNDGLGDSVKRRRRPTIAKRHA